MLRSILCLSAIATLGVPLVATASVDAKGKKTLHRKVPTKGTSSGTGTAPVVHDNAKKYKDTGKKPATGRSGSASLTVRALKRKDGKTEVELTTGTLDSSAKPPGNIAKAQFKAFASNKEVRYTRNFNNLKGGGYQKLVFDDLQRGQKIQAQAGIRGIDGNRTSVVTVQEEVKLRPNLRVSDLEAPGRAYVQTGVNISATVKETNHDVGARSDCVLYVDGTAVDRADGIWVDAGGFVSCAFTHAFDNVGTHEIAVAAENVVPADWNTSNNRASKTIEIVNPEKKLAYYAHFYDYDYTSKSKSSGSYKYEGSYPSKHDYYREYESSGWVQQGYISGWRSEAVSFPVKQVKGQLSTDGRVIDQITLADLGADWTWDYSSGSNTYKGQCAYRYAADHASHLHVCSYKYDYGGSKWEHTSAYYSRYAGDVTYYSRGYTNYWSLRGSGSYSHNYSGRNARGTRHTLGKSVTLEVSVDDGGVVFKAAPELKLEPYQWHSKQPWTCREYSSSYYTNKYCYEYDHAYDGVRASKYDYTQ